MDAFLSSLQKLVDSKRLQPAERIICDHLVNYESILPKTIDDELFSKVESVLINLLSVNKGELSLQCSIRIAICLLHLYKSKEISRQNEGSSDRSEKTWNLFADVAKRPQKANIFATGFIIKILGKNFASKITSFAKNLLNLTKNNNLIQPILYALNFCFKRARKEMNDNFFFDRTLKLALKVLQTANSSTTNSNSNESEQMLTIRLLKTIINPKSSINLNSTAFQKVMNSLKSLMDENSNFSPFAREETSFLIAKYLIRDLEDCFEDDSLYSININTNKTNKTDNNKPEFENENNLNEFKINTIDKNKENQEQEKLNKSFSFLLREFPSQLHNIFRKLILMVTPSYIHQNINVFFAFISKNIPEDLPHLIDLISNDDRKLLFDKLESIKDHFSADNLFMMKVLSNYQESLNLTAATAFQMVTKKSDQLRDAAINFFTRLAIRSVNVSSPYVQASSSFLSKPPDISQNISREIKGYAIVASTIISQRPKIAYQFRGQIELAISNGLKSRQMTEGQFQAAFTLMTGCPKSIKEDSDISDDDPYKYSDSSSFFSLEEADRALELFSNYFEANEIFNENTINLCQGLAAQIAMFIVQYPRLKNSTRAILSIYNNEELSSFPTHCCALKAFSDLVLNPDSEKFAIVIGRKLRSLINSSTPPIDFVFHSLKSPMLSPPMLLRITPVINREVPTVFINVHPNVFAQNAIILYPKFILSLPNDMGKDFLTLLFTNQLINYKMSPILILYLLRNQKTADMLYELSINYNTNSKDHHHNNNNFVQDGLIICLFNAINSFSSEFTKSKSLSNSALSSFTNSPKPVHSTSSSNLPLTAFSSSTANFSYTCSSVSSMNDIQLSLKVQTLAECIALYTSQHEKLYLNAVLNHIMKYKPSREKCFLLAALFTYNKDIPEVSIVDIMLELNNIAMTTEYQAYALFALMILYQNYMVQLSLIPFTSNQVDFFFSIFQLPGSISPFIMYYMAQSFNALTLILSPDIKMKEDGNNNYAVILNTIKNIIFCFANSEVPFSKGVYYHVLRAAFAFERDLLFGGNPPMKEGKELQEYLSSNHSSDSDPNSYLYSIYSFPSSRGTSLSLKTAACGVFSDYAKMIDPKIDFFYLIPQIIMILQTTSDTRASDFISTLVNNFINNSKGNENDEKVRIRLKEWVKLVRLCNSKGVLPGTPDVSSGISVRRVCTTVAISLLPLLYSSKPLMNECMDDIIASAIDSLVRNENEYSYLSNHINSHTNMQFDLNSHTNFDWSSHLTRSSIDNSGNSLQSDCFNLLVEIIKTFGELKDENGKRILDLYDSQFSTALKIAFSSSNLSISGNFLSSFLLFHINDLSVNEGVLNGFIECMNETKSIFDLNSSFFSNSKQKYTALNSFEAAYLSIAAQLVSIARNNKSIFEKIKELTPEFLVHFNDTVAYSRSLWYKNVDELANINFDSNANTDSDYLASKWSEISSFRSMLSKHYAKIVSSLVWLIYMLKKGLIGQINSQKEDNSEERNEIVSVEDLAYFFIAEVTRSQEAWRMNASLNGLASLVEFEMMDLKLFNRFLHSIIKSTRIVQASDFQSFILACTMVSGKEDIWDLVTSLFLTIESKKDLHTALAYLINNGTSKQVSEKSDIFFDIIQSSFSDDKALPLLTLLFDKSDSKIDDYLFKILSQKEEEGKTENNENSRSDSFIISIIYRSLKRNTCTKSMKLIDDFSISHFIDGGCELMGYTLLRQSELSPSGDLACHFFEDSRFIEFYEKYALFENLENSKNGENSEKKLIPSFALKMLQLGYVLIQFKQLRNNDRLITSILSFSLNYITESVINMELSKKLATVGALIWREVNKNDKMMLKVTFKNLGVDKGQKLVNKIEKATPLIEKRRFSLKTFAQPGQLRKLHAQDSWQDLTPDDK
ncbi:hypothetical protein M9Y10_016467 [Tritrichomonas musculus]|uniref:Uncharacterized protein n=1 Tax=Tritrichomonas musculus TaxID=1915356 RepID=A0ABR2HY13_9EUKA